MSLKPFACLIDRLNVNNIILSLHHMSSRLNGFLLIFMLVEITRMKLEIPQAVANKILAELIILVKISHGSDKQREILRSL